MATFQDFFGTVPLAEVLWQPRAAKTDIYFRFSGLNMDPLAVQ